MKIIRLQSENIKRIKAVDIRPDGNLVQITGPNGSGKTSTLDSIWWALSNARHIQSVPIRKGANEARIRLDLGELVVTRKFRRREDGSTHIDQLVVETADGARLRKPQDVVDGLIGALAFDPLAFARAEPKQQFETLKRFVPGVDFAAIEGRNTSDREARTEVGRTRDRERAAAGVIDVPTDTPAELIDFVGLVNKLGEASSQNMITERRKANRAAAIEKIADSTDRATALRNQIAARVLDIRKRRDRRVAGIESEIKRLKEELTAVHTQATDDEKIAADTLNGQADALIAEARALQEKLDAAGDLPALIDTAALQTEIEAAKATNDKVALRQRREAHAKAATEAEAEWKRLTDQIEARNVDKEAKIAAAKLPVEGLGFGDGVVLFNGLPFDQASDAEQLRVSCAIAMSGDPKLRVIRVRDGSLLDDNGLQLLADLADKHDMQVWLESVDTSGKVGFVIEDGRLRDAPSEAAGEAA